MHSKKIILSMKRMPYTGIIYNLYQEENNKLKYFLLFSFIFGFCTIVIASRKKIVKTRHHLKIYDVFLIFIWHKKHYRAFFPLKYDMSEKFFCQKEKPFIGIAWPESINIRTIILIVSFYFIMTLFSTRARDSRKRNTINQ